MGCSFGCLRKELDLDLLRITSELAFARIDQMMQEIRFASHSKMHLNVEARGLAVHVKTRSRLTQNLAKLTG